MTRDDEIYERLSNHRLRPPQNMTIGTQCDGWDPIVAPVVSMRYVPTEKMDADERMAQFLDGAA